MLVLSRHRDESVVIANGLVTVTVVEIRGDKVRLGFTAARDVSIHRQEVQDKVDAEGRGRSAGGNGGEVSP